MAPRTLILTGRCGAPAEQEDTHSRARCALHLIALRRLGAILDFPDTFHIETASCNAGFTGPDYSTRYFWRTVMPWDPTLIQSEVLAVHAAFLNYGQIIYFG